MEKTGGRSRGKGEGKVQKGGSGARSELTLIDAAWYASSPPSCYHFSSCQKNQLVWFAMAAL